jgi:Tol biopolymer transport system component
MHKDGSGLKRLTMGPPSQTNPGWSADGKWIYFQSRSEGDGSIWKVPVEGGKAVLVLGVRGGSAVESPDGKFLYYDGGWPTDYSVWRRPTGGGKEIKVVDSLHPQAFAWVALNDGVYFISKADEKGASHIRFKDVTTGSVRTIAPIERQVSQGLTVSPNRRSLLYSQVDESGSDLMLVENFR